MTTPYQILGVAETAQDAEIHAAYLEKVRRFPPEQYESEFRKIKDAYEILKTEKKRLAYRLFQLWDTPPSSPGETMMVQKGRLSYNEILDLLKKRR